MTAPDVDALEAERAAAAVLLYPPDGFQARWSAESTARRDRIADALLAAVRERDALRAAVEELTKELDQRASDDVVNGPAGGAYRVAGRRLRALLAAVDGGGQR